MRRHALIAPALLLASCDNHPDPPPGDGQAVHVAADEARGFSVSVPGLDARLSLPGLDLSRHVDLGGIRLAPGTAVRTMDVAGRDRPGGGTVDLAFASPRPPAELIDYYRGALARAGFGDPRATASTLTATRGGRRFALAVGPDGRGATGTIAMTGE